MNKLSGGVANLLYLVKPYWKYGKLYLLGRIAIALLITPAQTLIEVSVIQTAIDAIASGSSMRAAIIKVALLFAAILGLTLLQWGFLLLYDRWKAQAILIKINRSIYEQAIATDYEYFDNPDFYNSFTFAAGELASKSESALQLLTELIASISVITAMTAYLSMLGPWIIIISIAGQAVCLFAQRLIQIQGIRKAERSLPHDRKLNYVHRVAYQKQYAADMKSTDLPRKLLALFDKSGADKIEVYKKMAASHFGANLIQFAAWNICRLAQLVYLIARIYARNLSLGTISGMFAAATNLNNQLNRIVGYSGRVMELGLYAEKIRAFWEFNSKIEPRAGGKKPPEGDFAITLKNVSFSYPNTGFALHNFNLSIAPGEKIAIVGENGAGKTTLAKLLLRLYDANGGGEVLYNGADIREYDIHLLRRKIGVAFQEPQLYAFSVRENMELYDAASDKELRDALEKAGLDIGLDNAVTREFDDNGVVLSGGQTQKLGLTRLLHGQFGLLLLDEPSSALDPIAEYEMTKLIFEQSDATTIMIAHRLNTVRSADKIYLVGGGTIAECGSHDELMALDGKYAEMFIKQAEHYI